MQYKKNEIRHKTVDTKIDKSSWSNGNGFEMESECLKKLYGKARKCNTSYFKLRSWTHKPPFTELNEMNPNPIDLKFVISYLNILR